MASLSLFLSLVACLWKRIKKFKETDNLRYIYKNEINKAWFAHKAVYANSKGLAKRTILHRANEIALHMMDFKEDCQVWCISFLQENRIRVKCKWSVNSRTAQTSD